jgi:hypothetical protein
MHIQAAQLYNNVVSTPQKYMLDLIKSSTIYYLPNGYVSTPVVNFYSEAIILFNQEYTGYLTKDKQGVIFKVPYPSFEEELEDINKDVNYLIDTNLFVKTLKLNFFS